MLEEGRSGFVLRCRARKGGGPSQAPNSSEAPKQRCRIGLRPSQVLHHGTVLMG